MGRVPRPPQGFIGKPRPPANLNGGMDLSRRLREAQMLQELDKKFAAARQKMQIPVHNPYIPQALNDEFEKIVEEECRVGKPQEVVLEKVVFEEKTEPQSVYSPSSLLARVLNWIL